MCLYKTHIFPKISSKPITVYKYLTPIKENFVRIGFETPILKTKVQIGDTIKARKSWFWGIFSTIIKGEGVHAMTDFSKNYYYAIIKSEIPPYTPYWIGDDGDIAASRIKLIKLL